MKKAGLILTSFLTFMKIGLFTFGGGIAMLALLENEFVSKKKWIEKEEFLVMAAVAESTPGPIAINAATYIGYKIAGFLGALATTVAVCIPSFVILFLISLYFDAFLGLTYVAYAFRGIRVAVVYLILSVGIKLFKGLRKNPFSLSVFVCTLLAMVVFSVFAVSFSSIFFILIGGVAGLFVMALSTLREKRGEGKT